MLLTLSNGTTLNNAKLLAHNEDQSKKLYVAKWSNLWRYVVHFKGQDLFITGKLLTSVNDAIDHLSDHLHFADLDHSHVIDSINLDLIRISKDQKIAIKTAIMLLNQSNSDHADQALYHLNKLAEKL